MKTELMTLEEWLVEHISKHPNITFGSLYRDMCLTSKVNNTVDDLRPTISQCIEKGLITETKKDYNSFFNLDKQLDRENKINQLFKD